MLTAVTVLKSGGVFTPVWVERINRQIREHIRPNRIVCLTDMDVKSCEVIPLKHGWPGWFSKLELFRPGLFSKEETLLYFDLDTIIVQRVMVRTDGNPCLLLMLSDFYTPAIPASGMMIWRGDYYPEIYEEFAKNPSFPKSWREGDGAIIGKHCSGRIQQIWPGLVGSYKANNLKGGPRDYKICCFHGTPKQNDLPPNHWVRQEWEKPTE